LSRTRAAQKSDPLVRALAMLVVSASGLGAFVPAGARAQGEGGVALVVREGAGGSARCFDVDALRQRVAHYREDGGARADDLQLELYVDAEDSAELRVYRGAELAARRRFANLPAACADRRDAVALSIALALDAVIHEMASARGEEGVAGGASPREPAPGSGSGSGSGPQPASERTAPAPKPARAETRAPRATEAPRDADTRDGAAQDEDAAADDDDDNDNARTAERDVTPPSPSQPRGSHGGAPSVALHAGGRWLAGALPSPVWTGALGAELAFGELFAIDGSAIASTAADSTLAGASARTHLIGGELLGCTARGLGDFAAQGCLGAVVAACEASGEDFPVPLPSSTVLWAATAARLALRWPAAQRVSVRLAVEGHVNMVRPELRVDGSRARLSPSVLGGSAGLDLLVSLE
jgi:hypothetical protein